MTEPFPFFTTLRVRYNETDAQGHVNFSWYLNYFDVALTAYLRELGYSYQQMLADGVDMLYVDAHTAYYSPAYFDDLLKLHCRIGRIGNTSIRFDFQVFADEDERSIATGEITVVLCDREKRKKLTIPDKFRQLVAAYQAL